MLNVIDFIGWWIVGLAVIVIAVVWGLMFCILWVLDQISGWIHRRIASRRPWS